MQEVYLKMARRRDKLVWIPFIQDHALSTLGSGIVLSEAVVTLGEDFFWLGVKAAYSLRGHAAAEGPISVGWAHGDLSVGEVAEALDASLTDPDDIIAKERARRPVRRVGIFAGAVSDENLAHGEEITTRTKFSVGDGHILSMWARNDDSGALTGNDVIHVVGAAYGRWQR